MLSFGDCRSDKVPSLALVVREGLGTLGGPNCSSNICTSGWRLQSAVAAMVPTVPWGLVGGCGAPCAHHATKCLSSGGLFWTMDAMFNVIFQQGSCTATSGLPIWNGDVLLAQQGQGCTPAFLEWQWLSSIPRLDSGYSVSVCHPYFPADQGNWLLIGQLANCTANQRLGRFFFCSMLLG